MLISQKIATMALFHSGQVCLCIKRIYIHSDIYDVFLSAFVTFVKTLKTGASTDPEAVLGPIQNSMQYAKLLDMYSQISTQKWKVAYGSDSIPSDPGFFLPTPYSIILPRTLASWWRSNSGLLSRF
jgi:acyl-CoA reductase-like NAD-dependent aldehyde dehydrogenase